MAFDCHWILINEVSIMDELYKSCTECAFSSPYCLNCQGNTFFFHVLETQNASFAMGVCRREESLKRF